MCCAGGESLHAAQWQSEQDQPLLLHSHLHTDTHLLDLHFRAPAHLADVLEALSKTLLSHPS